LDIGSNECTFTDCNYYTRLSLSHAADKHMNGLT
jgi:hypothetical protein